MLKLEMEGIIVIGGGLPVVSFEPGVYKELPEPQIVMAKNQLFTWSHFSWWKRWLLKKCGLMEPWGRLKITRYPGEQS